MENNEIILNDISNELLILNKITIEKLFSLKEDSAIVLYMFYYKTAKWQQTNKIYATDTYVKQCLDWGNSKLQKAKNILKENKLIEVMQQRESNRISGWYIKLNYFNQKQEPQKQEPQNPTSSKQETNAYNNKLNAYNNIINNIVEYLNEKANVNYKTTTKKTRDLIIARLREGFTEEDFYKVIDKKCDEWLNNEMSIYLRPETLFGNKFESYLNGNKVSSSRHNNRSYLDELEEQWKKEGII